MSTSAAGVAEVLWPAERGTKRGPKPSLSLEEIAAEATRIADTDALEAVTMQRVAEGLGRTKMSLYRYTPGRAELLAVMADTALGVPPALSGGGWRSRLRRWGLASYDAFRRHPWLFQVLAGPRVLGPNEMGWLEAALGVLSGTGLTAAEQLDTVALVTGHVRGLAQQGFGEGGTDTEAGTAELMGRVMANHADRFPRVTATMAESVAAGATGDAVAFGLERILDGLAVLIDQRSRAAG